MSQNAQMQTADTPINKPKIDDPNMIDSQDILMDPVQMIDRSAPTWARPLSWFFAFGSAICILSICVLTVFFADMSVRVQQPFMAILLAGLGVIPVLGIIIFEFSHAKALAGYRIFRERNEVSAQAAMAVIVFVLLEFIHPLLGVAIPVGVALTFGAVRMLNRFSRREPMWDFLPAEAISVFAGRDRIGKDLTLDGANAPALQQGFVRAAAWFSLMLSLACSSWLAAHDVVAPAATVAVALITFWSVRSLGRFVVQGGSKNPMEVGLAASVTRVRVSPDPDSEMHTGGLRVDGLTVLKPDQNPILSDVRFHIEPGKVLGLIGPPGAGKTTLMQALISPYDLAGLNVRGAVRMGESDLWERSNRPSNVPALMFPSVPLVLPTSGQNNLSFFETGPLLEQGKRILEQMVFASDIVESICSKPDATKLSASEQKALAFARGFLMSPHLYLLDRPEDGVSEKLMGALVARMRQECRAGRSFIVVTENRAMLDVCDKLLMLHEGRVIDFGPAQEIRERQSSGWHRFVGARSLETEENLETWVRSHFRRDGDEINRRNACMIAAELLAFSCQNVEPLSHQSVSFEFKHFEGHCLIKLKDRDLPISSGVLTLAENEAADADGSIRLSPLAMVFNMCSQVEATIEQDQRVVLAKLETYDPRKSGGRPPAYIAQNAGAKGADTNATKA
jgi:ABC-type multidrug transport system ATPase subunit